MNKALEQVILRAVEYRRVKGRTSTARALAILNSIFEALDQSGLREGEPILVLKAGDAAGPDAVRNYGMQAEHVGAGVDFLADVSKREQDFREWQRINENLVKIPGLT